MTYKEQQDHQPDSDPFPPLSNVKYPYDRVEYRVKNTGSCREIVSLLTPGQISRMKNDRPYPSIYSKHSCYRVPISIYWYLSPQSWNPPGTESVQIRVLFIVYSRPFVLGVFASRPLVLSLAVLICKYNAYLACAHKFAILNTTLAGSCIPAIRMNGHFPLYCHGYFPSLSRSFSKLCIVVYLQSSAHDHNTGFCGHAFVCMHFARRAW